MPPHPDPCQIHLWITSSGRETALIGRGSHPSRTPLLPGHPLVNGDEFSDVVVVKSHAYIVSQASHIKYAPDVTVGRLNDTLLLIDCGHLDV